MEARSGQWLAAMARGAVLRFVLEPAGNLSPSIFLGNLLGQPLAAHRGDDDDDDDVEKDDDDDDDDDG